MPSQYMIKSAFQSPLDAYDGSGKRPVVFDIIGPDRVTSLLPDDLRLVLHANPQSMAFTYAKTISRQQTLAGYVETHWGSNPTEISFTMTTGGFMRLYSGLSYTTGPTPSNDLIQPASMKAVDVRGTRRDTIAYDKFLDMLALFHNNGAVYDSRGTIAFQGQILCTYDEGSWWGWFTSFSVDETADKPYQFTLNASFTVERELHRTKSVYVPRDVTRGPTSQGPSAGTTGGGTAQDPDFLRQVTGSDLDFLDQEENLTGDANQQVPTPANRERGTSRTPGTGGRATSGRTSTSSSGGGSGTRSSNRGTTNTGGPSSSGGASASTSRPNPSPQAPNGGQATFSSSSSAPSENQSRALFSR